jgi:hypothetical protein
MFAGWEEVAIQILLVRLHATTKPLRRPAPRPAALGAERGVLVAEEIVSVRAFGRSLLRLASELADQEGVRPKAVPLERAGNEPVGAVLRGDENNA